MTYNQPSRPNPHVRRDWRRTRRDLAAQERKNERARQSEFTTEQQRQADRRVADAEELFPPTPVASRYERAFRRGYLAEVRKPTGMVLSPHDYSRVRIRRAGRALSYVISTVLVSIGLVNTPGVYLEKVLAGLVLFFMIGVVLDLVFIGAIAGTWEYYRYREMLADRRAYFAWKEQVGDTTPL